MPYVTQVTADAPGVFVAASDYLKVLPDAIDRWLPRKLHSLGTDGFGRSETRAALRNFFEVDARFITLATLLRPDAGEAGRGQGGGAGHQGPGHRHREGEPRRLVAAGPVTTTGTRPVTGAR